VTCSASVNIRTYIGALGMHYTLHHRCPYLQLP
jgi:hypothetical protein